MAEMDHVPIAGFSILRRILAHRRDDDAVRKLERAEFQRRKQMRHVGLSSGPMPEATYLARLPQQSSSVDPARRSADIGHLLRHREAPNRCIRRACFLPPP